MRLAALLIAGVLPVATTPLPAAPPPVRHLSTAGTVWINAAALPSGSSIFNGDTVATAENGFALMTSPEEGRFEIRQDTLVNVAEGEITLQGGVVASAGLPVRMGPALVRPAEPAVAKPWFVVSNRDGQKVIAAYSGSVLIAGDNDEPFVLPEGFYAVPGDTPNDTSNTGRNQKDPDASNDPTQSKQGNWAIFSLTSGAAVTYLVSLGATAVFASMVAYTLGQESVSPSN